MESDKTIFAEERKLKIVELVRQKTKVTVPQLCDLFTVSSATIRNDLRELQANGLLIRTHGGAISKTKMSFELDASQKGSHNLFQKQRIAQVALGLIEDGDRVILDTGTTTLELAKQLHRRKNLTVLTNDLEIARTLEDTDAIEIILLGGFVRKRFHCTIGPLGEKMLQGLTVDKAFLGTNSFSFEDGASTPDINQAQIKKAMIAIANKVIVLFDSSKYGKASFAQFATLEEIDTIITDALSAHDKHHLEETDLEVIVA